MSRSNKRQRTSIVAIMTAVDDVKENMTSAAYKAVVDSVDAAMKSIVAEKKRTKKNYIMTYLHQVPFYNNELTTISYASNTVTVMLPLTESQYRGLVVCVCKSMDNSKWIQLATHSSISLPRLGMEYVYHPDQDCDIAVQASVVLMSIEPEEYDDGDSDGDGGEEEKKNSSEFVTIHVLQGYGPSTTEEEMLRGDSVLETEYALRRCDLQHGSMVSRGMMEFACTQRILIDHDDFHIAVANSSARTNERRLARLDSERVTL